MHFSMFLSSSHKNFRVRDFISRNSSKHDHVEHFLHTMDHLEIYTHSGLLQSTSPQASSAPPTMTGRSKSYKEYFGRLSYKDSDQVKVFILLQF